MEKENVEFKQLARLLPTEPDVPIIGCFDRYMMCNFQINPTKNNA